MQGTIVMLMALTSLGCKHKSCDVAPVASCYSSCYSSCSSASYTTVQTSCYTSSCYSSGGSCYGGGGCYSSCYSGGHGHRKMFGGMFGHKRRGHQCSPVASCDVCSPAPAVYGCYSSAPVYAAPQSVGYASPQSYGAPVAVSKTLPTAQAPGKSGMMGEMGSGRGMMGGSAVPVTPSSSIPPPPVAAPVPIETAPASPVVPPVPAVPNVNPNS